MGHYILSFTVYTLAMTGLIFFALFAYKKVVQGNIGTKNSKMLSVEETMSISPRKTLMIVKAGEERFLIASDVDKTTLISKLDNHETIKTAIPQEKIEHFKNIETEPVDLNVYTPQNDIQQQIAEQDIVKPEVKKQPKAPKTPVHLEVVTDKNMRVSELRKTQRERKGRRNITIDVTDTTNHGFSTLREMVSKVNEM